MSSRFILPLADVGNGISPSDGAQLTFFVTGTSDLKDTFSDEALLIANANPVIANSDGLFPEIWIADGSRYKVTLKDKNNKQTWEEDPVVGAISAIASARTFDTKALMVADEELVLGQTVDMSGYTAVDTGGGSSFDIVAAGSAGVDDGGSVIDLPNTTPALQAKNLFPGGVRSIDQWGADASGDVATAVQAALDYFLANGGELVADGEKTYQLDTAITLLNAQAVSADALSYKLDFKGATLDFSSTALTTGALFTVGSTTVGNFEGAISFNLRDMILKGPETLTPTGNAQTTTTIGLSLTFAKNVVLENILTPKWFEGIRTIFTFPLTATQCDGSLSYIPLRCKGASNTQVWINHQSANTRFGPVIEDEDADNKIDVITFINPRVEGADAGFQIDTGPGSTERIRDINIINPYFAAIESDFIRIGTSFTKDSPLSRGSTRSSHLNGFTLTGGNWNNGLSPAGWSATRAAIFAGSMTWRAAHVLLPVKEEGDSVPNPPINGEITYISSVHDISAEHSALVFDNEGNVVSRLDKNGQQYVIATFVDLDTTPDVTQGNIFKTANTGATLIADFDGLGSFGKDFTIFIGDNNTTFDFSNANIFGNNEVDYLARTNDVIEVSYDGTSFFCEIRHTGNDANTAIIASGVITVTPGTHDVLTETGATDDLDTINGLGQGERVTFFPSDAAKTVVFKHATGNIRLNGQAEFSLDGPDDVIELERRGANMVELTSSNNGA